MHVPLYSLPAGPFPYLFFFAKARRGVISKTAFRGKAKENKKQTSATKAVLRARISTKIGGDCENRRLGVHPRHPNPLLASRSCPPCTCPAQPGTPPHPTSLAHRVPIPLPVRFGACTQAETLRTRQPPQTLRTRQPPETLPRCATPTQFSCCCIACPPASHSTLPQSSSPTTPPCARTPCAPIP